MRPTRLCRGNVIADGGERDSSCSTAITLSSSRGIDIVARLSDKAITPPLVIGPLLGSRRGRRVARGRNVSDRSGGTRLPREAPRHAAGSWKRTHLGWLCGLGGGQLGLHGFRECERAG